VYPRSRILIFFTHPGSRISDPGSKSSNKESGEKNLLSYLFLYLQISQNEQWFKMVDNERTTRRTGPLNIQDVARLETRKNCFPEARNNVPRDIRQARTAQAFKKAYKDQQRQIAAIS
jgi:hypothetical protein